MAIERVTTVDIEEPPPEEEPPPPPPPEDTSPPPPVAPPPPPPPRVQPKGPEPRGNPSSWANSNDYPSRALREEREGVTRFSVQVDASGRVSSCTVTGSSGHPDLDSTTCSLIQRRGRFRPATNGNGDAVSGSWSSAVRWEIPK
jgi:protein TonB